MEKPFEAAPRIEVLPSHFPIPGMGVLAINAFVLKAKEPVLIETGMGIDREEFMEALESVIDPVDLKWVWLSHDDADHTGNLQEIMEAAPHARLVANALAVLRMSTVWPVPMDRVYWLNPGESIDAGDRKLTAVRPPLFDNPTTIGCYDDKSEAFFCADFFGAIIPASARDADDIPEADLAQGMASWASADSPWVHMVEPAKFGHSLAGIDRMAPKLILSAHLPPARDKLAQFLKVLAAVPAAEPFTAPNQVALEQLLAQMKAVN